MAEPVVRAEALVKEFPVASGALRGPKKVLHALNGVSLSVEEGESQDFVILTEILISQTNVQNVVQQTQNLLANMTLVKLHGIHMIA